MRCRFPTETDAARHGFAPPAPLARLPLSLSNLGHPGISDKMGSISTRMTERFGCRHPFAGALTLTCSNRPICGRPASMRRSEIVRRGIERIDGADQIVVEADQILSGIGLISNAGRAVSRPPRPSPPRGASKTCTAGTTPSKHLKDMALDGVAGEVLYPSQGLFLLQGGGPAADVRHLSRVQRLARRILPHGSRPPQGHRDDQPGRRPGRDQGAGGAPPAWASPAR